jgi:hypothetical protein
VIPSIVKLLRFASIVICGIVIASFAIFVINQTSAASKHQSEEVSNGPAAGGENTAVGSKSHEGAVHKAIDEASTQLTSPFAGVVSGSSSEWLIRGVKLLLALVVYGLGFGYLARVLHVRV